MYKIYHIPGVKIGCTNNLTRRIREQGFTNYEILEEHADIDFASKREIELQNQYGYIEKCKIDYKTSVLNASKNKGGFKKGYKPWNDGITHSELTKQKISLANLGRKQSDEERFKRKLSSTNKSDEYRKSQSERIKEWWRLRKQKLS